MVTLSYEREVAFRKQHIKLPKMVYLIFGFITKA